MSAEQNDGCDCTELCDMGPTCPGGMLAQLPGSGCARTLPAPDAATVKAGIRHTADTDAATRLARGLRGERP